MVSSAAICLNHLRCVDGGVFVFLLLLLFFAILEINPPALESLRQCSTTEPCIQTSADALVQSEKDTHV